MSSSIYVPHLGPEPLAQSYIPYQRQQSYDPAEGYQRLLQLQSLMQGRQLRDQELQNAQQQNQGYQIENQQRAAQAQLAQQQLNDQNLLRQSGKDLDWSKADAFDQFLTNAGKQGVSPQTLQAMQSQRQQFLKQIAETDEATNKATQVRNNLLLGHIDAIRNANDDQRAQVSQAQAAQILDGGLVKDPRIAQIVQSMALGQSVPNDDQLQSFETGLIDHNTQIEQALKSAQTTEARARTGETLARTNESEARTKEIGVNTDKQELIVNAMHELGAGSPSLWASKYMFFAEKRARGEYIPPKDEAFMQAYEQWKTIVSRFNWDQKNQDGTPTPPPPTQEKK